MEDEKWVPVAPGIEVCVRPGDTPPTEAEALAECLHMIQGLTRRQAAREES